MWKSVLPPKSKKWKKHQSAVWCVGLVVLLNFGPEWSIAPHFGQTMDQSYPVPQSAVEPQSLGLENRLPPLSVTKTFIVFTLMWTRVPHNGFCKRILILVLFILKYCELKWSNDTWFFGGNLNIDSLCLMPCWLLNSQNSSLYVP